MSNGHLGIDALNSAMSLSDDLKNKIAQYEQERWAANTSLPDMQQSWRTFLSKLESAIKKNALTDNTLTQLISHLATLDTVYLLEQIGKLDSARQERFIQLLNWLAENSDDQEEKENAAQVRERILMSYRLSVYPKIFSPARIERAIHLLKNQSNR